MHLNEAFLLISVKCPIADTVIQNLPNAHRSSEPLNFYGLSQEAMELKTFLFQLETICI